MKKDTIMAAYDAIKDKKGPIQIKCPGKDNPCYYSLSDQELIIVLGPETYTNYMSNYRVKKLYLIRSIRQVVAYIVFFVRRKKT